MKFLIPSRYLLRVALACCLISIRSGIAADIPITPDANVRGLCKKVKAGDSFVLEDGLWNDAELTFEQLPGTADAPIHIRAKTAGKVVFTGATKFRVSGQHISSFETQAASAMSCN